MEEVDAAHNLFLKEISLFEFKCVLFPSYFLQ